VNLRGNALKIILLLSISSYSLIFSQHTAHAVLQDYIKLKSESGHEKEAGLFMEKVARNMGFYTTIFSDSDSSYNFCASILPLNSNLKSVVLLNHIDVVKATDNTDWIHPPYSGKLINDTLYGRGTLDMKGLAVMQLFALKKIKDSTNPDSLKNNLLILFLSGEETGGLNGAAKIIEPAILNQIKPLVVFGEGGGGLKNRIPGKKDALCFFVSNAEKKSVWIKLEAKLKTRGHGSAAGTKTAHRLLLKAISKIENSEHRIVIDKSTKQTFKKLGSIMGGYRGFIIKHFDWWVFKPLRRKIINNNEALSFLVTNSYQLTRMDNPDGPVNQVAQSASAYYDCRLLPNKSEKPLLMKLLFRIVDPRIKITILDESPNAETTHPDIHFDYLSKAIAIQFPNASVIPVLFPATTDNSYFRSVDVPAYGVLPFELSDSMIESVHAANERIPLKAIETGIAVYVALLKNYVSK
jgi:carboxypeptidase PM20D1